jgi:hypothetical protein
MYNMALLPLNEVDYAGAGHHQTRTHVPSSSGVGSSSADPPSCE